MILCLSCRHVSPAGSAYCGYCARSLNQSFCGSGHANALGVLCCTTCGSPQLSESARGFRLGWVGSAVGGLLLLFAWKATLPYFPAIASLAFHTAAALTAFAFNTRAACVEGLLIEGISWLIVLTVLGYFLNFLPGRSGAVGTWLRSLPALSGRILWRGALRGCGWLMGAIRRLL